MVDSDKTQEGQTDFAAVVSKVEASAPDAVFYGGYAAEARPVPEAAARRRRRRRRSSAATASTAPTSRRRRCTNAEGAHRHLPVPPGRPGRGHASPTDFEAEYGTAPGAYAAEGYDAANIFLEGFEEGNTTRESMLECVNGYTR